MPDFTKQTTPKVDSYNYPTVETMYSIQSNFIYIRVPCLKTSFWQTKFSFHRGLRMAPGLVVRWHIWGEGHHLHRYLNFSGSNIPPASNSNVVSCFPTPKSHRTNYCFFSWHQVIHHRCPLSYNRNGVNVSCYTTILPTFPSRQFWRSFSSNKGTTSSKSVKHTCCPTAVVELFLGHHLFAFTQTKVHLVDGCVSRLWGNNKHAKNYSAPPELWNFFWGC